MGCSVDGHSPHYSAYACDHDMAELVELFVEDLASRMQRGSNFLDKGGFDELRTIAHQLKGAGGSYGFEPISASAAELERLIDEGGSRDQIRDQFEALAQVCRSARHGRPPEPPHAR